MRKIQCDKSGREMQEEDVITLHAHKKDRYGKIVPVIFPIEMDPISFSKVREFLEKNTNWSI